MRIPKGHLFIIIAIAAVVFIVSGRAACLLSAVILLWSSELVEQWPHCNKYRTLTSLASDRRRRSHYQPGHIETHKSFVRPTIRPGSLCCGKSLSRPPVGEYANKISISRRRRSRSEMNPFTVHISNGPERKPHFRGTAENAFWAGRPV